MGFFRMLPAVSLERTFAFKRFALLAPFVLLLNMGCVSVNVEVNFPAEDIEEQLNDTNESANNDGEQVTKSLGLILRIPEIRPIIESRNTRYRTFILEQLDRGTLGEALNGLIAIRESSQIDANLRQQLEMQVERENNERMEMFALILEANGLDVTDSNLEQIQDLNYRSMVNQLSPGHFYQIVSTKEPGSWEWTQKEE